MQYYNIISELSEHHWAPFDVSGKIVLDLGCGRNWTKLPEDSSPFYFGKSGATKVIGIDASEKEIEFLEINNHDKDKYKFLSSKITSIDDIRKLIAEYKPTAIKSDIEGYEIVFYDMKKEELAEVEVIAMEYHSNEILRSISGKMTEWGFIIHEKGKFTEDRNWLHMGSIDVNPEEMGVLFCRR